MRSVTGGPCIFNALLDALFPFGGDTDSLNSRGEKCQLWNICPGSRIKGIDEIFLPLVQESQVIRSQSAADIRGIDFCHSFFLSFHTPSSCHVEVFRKFKQNGSIFKALWNSPSAFAAGYLVQCLNPSPLSMLHPLKWYLLERILKDISFLCGLSAPFCLPVCIGPLVFLDGSLQTLQCAFKLRNDILYCQGFILKQDIHNFSVKL